jgi:hypothetical protein
MGEGRPVEADEGKVMGKLKEHRRVRGCSSARCGRAEEVRLADAAGAVESTMVVIVSVFSCAHLWGSATSAAEGAAG